MALTDNLVSFWELEEASGNRVDSHGSADLTATNSPTSGTGKVGDAVDLNGTNQRLSSTSSTLRFNGDTSLQFWVNIDTTSPTRHLLFNTFTVSGGVRGLITGLEKVSGVYRVRFANYINPGADKDYTYTAGGAISTGTWYHIVYTYDLSAGEVKFYLDDSLLHTETGYPTSINTDMTTAYLGIDGNLGAGNYFGGLLDQVGVWNSVLTSGEVTDLYNSGAGLSYAAMSGGGAPANNALAFCPF